MAPEHRDIAGNDCTYVLATVETTLRLPGYLKSVGMPKDPLLGGQTVFPYLYTARSVLFDITLTLPYLFDHFPVHYRKVKGIYQRQLSQEYKFEGILNLLICLWLLVNL